MYQNKSRRNRESSNDNWCGKSNKRVTLSDHAVGIKILKKVGDYVTNGEKLGEIYYNDPKNANNSKEMLLDAYELSSEKVEVQKAIIEIIE